MAELRFQKFFISFLVTVVIEQIKKYRVAKKVYDAMALTHIQQQQFVKQKDRLDDI